MNHRFLSIACIALYALSLTAYAAPPNEPPSKNERASLPDINSALEFENPAPYALTLDSAPEFALSGKVTVENQSPEYQYAFCLLGDESLPCSLLCAPPSMAESDTGKLLEKYSTQYSTLASFPPKRSLILYGCGGVNFRASPIRLL